MNVEHYKGFYQHEWQRHEQLQSAANTPISVVTLLAGGLVLMGKSFESQASLLEWLFWMATAVASALVCASVYLLIRSIHGYRYHRIPLPAELALHHEQLKVFYRDRERSGLTDPAFDAFLGETYIVAADRNAVNNSERGEYLYRANRFLVYALCATACACVPAAIAVKATPTRPQDVRITNLRSDASAILEAWNAERPRDATSEGSAAPRARRRSAEGSGEFHRTDGDQASAGALGPRER